MKLTSQILSSRSFFFEWKCCGYTWQLILSPKTIDARKNWSPTCPECKAIGEKVSK